MQPSEELTKMRISNPILRIVVLIIILFIGVFLGMQYEKNTTSIYDMPLNTSNLDTTSKTALGKCKYSGMDEDLERIFTKYTVLSGDTLLKVAREQLGSTSRIQDIIYSNQKRYPELSVQNPYIEPGWILLLPPSYIKYIDAYKNVYSGKMDPKLPYSMEGELIEKPQDNMWVVQANPPSVKSSPATIYFGEETEFMDKPKSSYQVGDCLTIIREGYGSKTFAIFPQK